VHYPILLGALDITYLFPSGNISGPLNLTADILSAIYQNQIQVWNDPRILALNPYLTYTGQIYAVARADSSGMYLIFVNASIVMIQNTTLGATQVFTNYLNIATVNAPWGLSVDMVCDYEKRPRILF